jgi:hypothetical protein
MYALSYLSDYLGNGSATRFDISESQHPVMSGAHGNVTDFVYKADADQVSAALLGETVLMTTTEGAPALLAAENGVGQRTVSLMASVYNSHDCPISDADGLGQLEIVFKNAISWLEGWQ